MQQPGQQVRGAEREQVAVRIDGIAMLQRHRADRTIALGEDEQHQRQRQFPDADPLALRECRQRRRRQRQVDPADDRDALCGQVQPLRRRDTRGDHPHRARQLGQAREQLQGHE
jgi:hypothetical protein